MSQQEQEGVFSRWSRRKLQTEEETRQEEILLESTEPDRIKNEAVIDGGNLDTVESPGEPVLTDEDMPPIESLDESSDFSMFMSSGVSDKLRNRALGKMFHAPVFNIRDGLDEYDEDYTYFEKLGDIVTCDMKYQVEMQEKKKQKEAELLVTQETEAIEDEEGGEQPVLPESGQADQIQGDLDASHSETSSRPETIETKCHE